MTKKDYILIADTIAKVIEKCDTKEFDRDTLINKFTDMLSQENERFNQAKFIEFIDRRVLEVINGNYSI